MNRRDLLVSTGAFALTAGVHAIAADGDGISKEAHALYERAIVFDANLSPPLYGELPLKPEDLAMLRSSGVTAMKTSLGGTDEKFEDTIAEIAYFQRVVEYYPDVFLQIRQASDFVRAKREKKTGIILSFESTDMFDGKVERIELFRDLGVRVMQMATRRDRGCAAQSV